MHTAKAASIKYNLEFPLVFTSKTFKTPPNLHPPRVGFTYLTLKPTAQSSQSLFCSYVHSLRGEGALHLTLPADLWPRIKQYLQSHCIVRNNSVSEG